MIRIKKEPLISATVKDGQRCCDLCPFTSSTSDPWKLMDAHMEKHASGRWNGK